jgi:hypothetical protein
MVVRNGEKLYSNIDCSYSNLLPIRSMERQIDSCQYAVRQIESDAAIAALSERATAPPSCAPPSSAPLLPASSGLAAIDDDDDDDDVPSPTP